METSPVTPKQLEILFLLYKFRFLDRYHIQTLLNHKYHHRVLAWLSDLTKKGYTGRIYSRNSSDNTKPAVYHLKKKSRYPLWKRKDVSENLLDRLYKESKRSRRFIEHCLFLANLHLKFLSHTKKRKAKFFFFTKTELSGRDYLPETLPDAYFAVKEKRKTQRYFLEILDKDTPRFALRGRLRQYLNYSEEEEWETHTGHPFPKILLIVPDEATRKYLAKFISRQLEEIYSNPRFYLVVEKEIRQHGLAKEMTWQPVELPEEFTE